MADRVERRTRGLVAIAITDSIHGLGLRPVSPRVVNLRALFRIGTLGIPSSALDLAELAFTQQAQSRATTIGCAGLFGALALPILVPIEIVRAHRVRRHNRAMSRLIGGSLPVAGRIYRDNAGGDDPLRKELLGAEALFATDWTIWRDGTVCLAGAALGLVRGNEHLVPWVTVHRGPPPRDAIDAAAVVRALPELPLVVTRWEWELHDPFEAVERR